MGGFMKKIVRKLTDCLADLCWASEQYGLKHEELAFTTFIIKVINPSKRGWEKGIIKILRNCKGARFKMDGAGVVEVSGISNPMKLMKKIGKWGKAELQWIQYGQCCTNLFMPPTTTQQDTNKDPPPLQHNYLHNPSYGYALPYNSYNYSHNHSLPPPSYSYVGGDYGYDHYQSAQAPYYYAPHYY